MKNTRFISIFLITALITSVFGFAASAQTAPNLSNNSVNVTGPHNATISVTINPNGNILDVHFKYWTGSVSKDAIYGNVRGTSSININQGIFNLLAGTTYSYQVVAGSVSTGVSSFTTPRVSGGSTGSNGNSGSNNSNNNGQAVNSNYSSSLGQSGAPLAPSVATNGPVSVTATSAVINGSVNPNNVYTSFWFEFGTSPSLGQKTSVQPAGVGNIWQLVTGDLSGLITGATYYYRVAAQNSQGTNWGEIKTFITTGNSTKNSTGGGQVLGAISGNGNNGNNGAVKNINTGKTAPANGSTQDRPSFASLEYSIGNDGSLVLVADDIMPKSGEEFSYTVVYKNDTNAVFSEAGLKAILPAQVEYVGSDRDPRNISANIVEFGLGDIAPRSQGAVVVIVKVKETVTSGTNMIFTSVLGYRDLKGVQLTNTAYMIVQASEANAPLSASIGLFIGTSGILWLIAIALFIMMGLLIFRLVRIRKNIEIQEEEDDIFESGRVPATFQPIGQPRSFKP